MNCEALEGYLGIIGILDNKGIWDSFCKKSKYF